MGIKAKPELDLPAMQKYKQEGVDGNVKGVEFLLKKNKVDTYHGMGRIAAPGRHADYGQLFGPYHAR